MSSSVPRAQKVLIAGATGHIGGLLWIELHRQRWRRTVDPQLRNVRSRLIADLEISGLSDHDLQNPPFMPGELVGLPYPRNRSVSDSSSLDRANGRSRESRTCALRPKRSLLLLKSGRTFRVAPGQAPRPKGASASHRRDLRQMWAYAGMLRLKRRHRHTRSSLSD